ncbi:MAG TPA: class I SAM-dependent methyltransferase [Mycobacterium sp.]|uniref:class I SAM-dependent methyltransferase n=1 Tax=Mycobacterium sp. TaxID=1785 RepID=UPI002D2D8CE4|nr:class I SAM-dependent methyltransferase [Mycobacterium sp.]HZU49928.1 class I SAM-dependent methyltransferase [Mycobacterium sp.]
MTRVDGNSLLGVSTTTLWTLRNRAIEAKRPNGVLDDPWAIALFDAIDYDYEKFGKPHQYHPRRALTFDSATAEYLRTHPKASVVALAEGLQTSFWRLDRAGLLDGVTWYSVDLPPVMALRRQLLPRDDRIVELAQSALDRSWMDRVETGHGVLITAEGLLMYLPPGDGRDLIVDCAARFPGGQMIFDSIPHWASRRTLQGWHLSDRYALPPMPFGQTADESVALGRQIPGVCAARDVPLRPGHGMSKLLAWGPVDRIRPMRRRRSSVTLLEFA